MTQMSVRVVFSNEIGQNESGIFCRNRMAPQARWPLVQTSVSGITPDVWKAFYSRADVLNLTIRNAVEDAMLGLVKAVDNGEAIVWPHPRHGRTRTIQMHEQVLAEVQRLMTTLDLRQNVIVLAAIQRWLEKHGP
jgi:hypothetical protein